MQSGRGGEPHLARQRGGRRTGAAHGSRHGGQPRRAGMAQVFLQKLWLFHPHAKAARRAQKARGRALYRAEQAQAVLGVGKAVTAQGHGAAFGL